MAEFGVRLRPVMAAVLQTLLAARGFSGDPATMENLREVLRKDPYSRAALTEFRRGIATETDANQRAHDLAIVYLGLLVEKDHAGAYTVYESLKTQHPQCVYVERLAPARFLTPCRVCHGTGTRKEPCSTCQGTNLCPTCKGARKLDRMAADKACPTCKGTGQCTLCDRKGRQVKPCHQCGGQARLVHPDRVMRVYKELLQHPDEKVRAGRFAAVWAGNTASDAPHK